MIEDILKRLAKARELAGLSQGQVAHLLGMESAATISHYESGLRKLTVIMLLRLCEAYDVSVIWIMTGTNPDFDPTPIMEAASRLKMSAEDFDKIMDMLEMSEHRKARP